MKPPLKRVLVYAAAGPAIGAVVVLLYFSVVTIIPDLLRDPGNRWGHNRLADFGGLVALTFIFAYPFGLPAALVAGITHAVLMPRFQAQRVPCTVAVGLAGLAVQLLSWPLLGEVSVEMVLPAPLSAWVLAWATERRPAAG